jgi:single-strand DNA-binding protein
MSGEPLITLVGNLGKDPEVFITKSGTAIGKFNVAVTPRKKEGESWVDDKTIWFSVSLWGRDGEAAVDSLKKGDKVIVTGRFGMFTYLKDGVEVSGPEVNADTVALVAKPKDVKAKPAAETTNDGSPW